jgi:hypothetical protein
MRSAIILACFLLPACGASGGSNSDGGSNGNPSGGTGGSVGAGGSGTTGGSGGGVQNTSGGSAGSNAAGGASGGSDVGGSAGSGGTDQVVPPVTPCDGLGAVDTWEEITPPEGAGHMVLTARIDPLDHATLYTTISNQGLFKSTDCGATFSQVNTGTNGSVLDGGQWAFLIDPNNHEVMYTSNLPPVMNGDLRLYKSTNSGVDWLPVWEDGSEFDMFAEISAVDTANSDHVVVNYHENCPSPNTPMCLAESFDGGATWELIDGPDQFEGWIEDAGPVVIDGVIYLGVPFGGLFASSDSGENWDKVSNEGYFEIMKADDGYYYMGGAQTKLQRSLDLTTWSQLEGTPWTVSNAIATDGQRIFAASRAFVMYVSAPVSDSDNWTEFDGPDVGESEGAKMFGYDSVNHVLYSANQTGGLHRMVTY